MVRPMFLRDRRSVCESKQVQNRSKQTGKIPKQAEIMKSQEEQGQECYGGSTDDLANGVDEGSEEQVGVIRWSENAGNVRGN